MPLHSYYYSATDGDAPLRDVLLHPDVLSDVERGHYGVLSHLRHRLPQLISCAIGVVPEDMNTTTNASSSSNNNDNDNNNNNNNNTSSSSTVEALTLMRVSRRILCGMDHTSVPENTNARCGPVWSAHTARAFLGDDRDAVERMCSAMTSACDAIEGVLPTLTAEETEKCGCSNSISDARSSFTDRNTHGTINHNHNHTNNNTSHSNTTNDSNTMIDDGLHPFVEWSTAEDLAQFLDKKCAVVQGALSILESLLVAIVLDNEHVGLPTDLSYATPLGDPVGDSFATATTRYDGSPHDSVSRPGPLHFIVDHAVRAFTHVFLSITSVQHQMHRLSDQYGSCRKQHGLSTASSGITTPRRSERYCIAERELSRRLEDNLRFLKGSAVAFVAHDADIAETAIEFIDSRGPVFTAQSTMLLAHVLTPQVLAAHPTDSRGGRALRWILSFVFDGCDGADVERTHKMRREQYENDSNPFSIMGSSSRNSSLSGSSNSSSNVGVGSPSGHTNVQHEDSSQQYSSAALRVEYVLAACFTRFHPLMTVIGCIAESNAYECGLVVAKAVLQYAVTLSLTSARFLRTPLVDWITPFTEAMMSGISDLANTAALDRALASEERKCEDDVSVASSWCTSSDTEDELPQDTTDGKPPQAPHHHHQHSSTLPDSLRTNTNTNSHRYRRFRPKTRQKVSGTTLDDVTETPTHRTTRRSVAIHWAKCVVLSGRTLLASGVHRVAVPREHYETLHHQSQRLEKMLRAWQPQAHEQGWMGVARVDALESAKPFHALQHQHINTAESALASSTSAAVQKQPLLTPMSHSPDGAHGGGKSSDCATDMGERESYKRAFLDSFCLGKSALDFFADAPYALVPVHEVLFASLFTVLDAVGDVLLCEAPRMNAVVINELVTLLYEVRLGMLESPPAAAKDADSSNAMPRSRSHSGIDGLSSCLITPHQYAVLLDGGLRLGEVMARWRADLDRNPNAPCAGYYAALRYLEQRKDCIDPDVEVDIRTSRATLRMLLGVSAREEPSGMRGHTLHVDDLDIEGSKREDLAPVLGVTASRGARGGRSAGTEVVDGPEDGQSPSDDPLTCGEAAAAPAASSSSFERVSLAARPLDMASPVLCNAAMSLKLPKVPHSIRLVGTEADIHVIASRAPATWQLPPVPQMIAHATRIGQRAPGGLLGVYSPASTNEDDDGSVRSLVTTAVLLPGVSSPNSALPDDIFAFNTSFPDSGGGRPKQDTPQRSPLHRRFTDYPLCSTIPEQDPASPDVPLAHHSGSARETLCRTVDLSKLPFTRRLLESGAFGPPGGNRSFSFFVDPERTCWEHNVGPASDDEAASPYRSSHDATDGTDGSPFTLSTRTRASSLPVSPVSTSLPTGSCFSLPHTTYKAVRMDSPMSPYNAMRLFSCATGSPCQQRPPQPQPQQRRSRSLLRCHGGPLAGNPDGYTRSDSDRSVGSDVST